MSTSASNIEDRNEGQIFDGTGDLPSVPVSQSPVEKFREYLDLHNLKCTSERMRLVEYVFEEHNHFEADQLVARVRERSLRVSRSTVYRTLTLLVEAGLLRELKLGSRTAYEHDYGYPQHEHLFCEKCGKVMEFVSEEISVLVDEICRKFHFRPTKHQFVVHGICRECRHERSPRRRLDLI